MARETCGVEGCLCATTIQPITEAVYGEKKRKRGKPEEYAPRGGTAAIWRRITVDQLDRLADVCPKARRFAARRRKEDA